MPPRGPCAVRGSASKAARRATGCRHVRPPATARDTPSAPITSPAPGGRPCCQFAHRPGRSLRRPHRRCRGMVDVWAHPSRSATRLVQALAFLVPEPLLLELVVAAHEQRTTLLAHLPRGATLDERLAGRRPRDTPDRRTACSRGLRPGMTVGRDDEVVVHRGSRDSWHQSGMRPASASSITASPNRLRTSDSRYGAPGQLGAAFDTARASPVTHDDSGTDQEAHSGGDVVGQAEVRPSGSCSRNCAITASFLNRPSLVASVFTTRAHRVDTDVQRRQLGSRTRTSPSTPDFVEL